jgi:hypothetical protein
VTQELQIPAKVAVDTNACELIRAWAANGGLVCSLDPGVWPKEEAAVAWGILLRDIARHVADALHQTYGLDQAEALSRVRSVFDAELNQSSGGTKGKLV